jgi:predicted metal-dependent hydrolase
MLDKYILYINEKCIEVEVVYSKRKTLGLEIKEGRVKARIPERVSDKRASSFIEEHREWIEKGLEKWERVAKEREKSDFRIPSPDCLSPGEIESIKKSFAGRVAHFANVMGVTYARVTIRNQKTRWGSCSSKGNLNFNYKLFFLDTELMEYVIIHELAHRVHMNHSKEFWNLVGKYCPDYKERRKRLKAVKF